jgi:PUA domain protein
MKIKSRYFARKDMIRKIRRSLEEVSSEFSKLLDGRVEIAEIEDGKKIILVNGEPVIFEFGGQYFPTVRGALKIKINKRFVTVDKGAISFVASGADVMRPGVVDIDREIKKGELVVVLEETHRKPLAIGVSLWDGEEFGVKDSGKCVKNILHVGDRLWNLKI